MKVNRNLTLGLLLGVVTLFTQCKDSGTAVEPDDENELITSVTLKFTEQGTANVTSFSYKDADGEGGNQPTRFDTISLKPNTTYSVAIELLDESKTPADDITKEVDEKSDEHLFIYTATPASLLTYTYGDKDKNGIKIGLLGSALSGEAGTGQLKIQLRHQPGAKDGTATPGSDDVNLDFTLEVE